MNKRRVEWVDVGKYICIMFVMLSHLESCTKILDKIYQPFFLTGFFFLAGYVYKKPDSFKELIIKKTRGLIVPWFILSNFNLILSSLITLKGNRNIIQEVLWNLVQIRGRGDGMWFIAALFTAFIPFYYFSQISNQKIMVSVSLVLAFGSSLYSFLMPKDIYPWENNALPWHIQYMFYAMFWMILGYCYKKGLEIKTEKYNTLPVTLFFVIFYLLIVQFVKNPNGILGLVVRYMNSIIGLPVLILLCKRIKSNKYISFVGANTIIYFGLHGKVYAVLEYILSSKVSNFYNLCLNNVAYSSLMAIALTVIMSIVLIIPAGIINRWFPWVLGRKKENK